MTLPDDGDDGEGEHGGLAQQPAHPQLRQISIEVITGFVVVCTVDELRPCLGQGLGQVALQLGGPVGGVGSGLLVARS